MQRLALISKLGLHTNHYLTLARPLPSALLAAMAVCLMALAQLYELLVSAPGPGPDPGWVGASAEPHTCVGMGVSLPKASADKSAGEVPGTVTVRAAPPRPQPGESPTCSQGSVMLRGQRGSWHLDGTES